MTTLKITPKKLWGRLGKSYKRHFQDNLKFHKEDGSGKTASYRK